MNLRTLSNDELRPFVEYSNTLQLQLAARDEIATRLIDDDYNDDLPIEEYDAIYQEGHADGMRSGAIETLQDLVERLAGEQWTEHVDDESRDWLIDRFNAMIEKHNERARY